MNVRVRYGSSEDDSGRRVWIGGGDGELESEAVVGVGCGGWCEDGSAPLSEVCRGERSELDGVEAAVGTMELVIASL